MVSAMVALFWAHNSQEMLVIYGTDLRQIFICGTYFWAGATLYKFKLDRYFTLQTVFASCVVMLCLEPYPALLQVAAWGALPFVVLAFGLSEASLLARLIGNRDYSYGVYIYAFPVQQSVVFLYPELQLPLYVGVCCTVTLLMAALSWHFVEEKALRFKPLKVRSNQTIAAAKVSRGTSSNASLG
jgi:peptidoglycan/LPS O-acetylase OafA/YrhL